MWLKNNNLFGFSWEEECSDDEFDYFRFSKNYYDGNDLMMNDDNLNRFPQTLSINANNHESGRDLLLENQLEKTYETNQQSLDDIKSPNFFLHSSVESNFISANESCSKLDQTDPQESEPVVAEETRNDILQRSSKKVRKPRESQKREVSKGDSKTAKNNPGLTVRQIMNSLSDADFYRCNDKSEFYAKFSNLDSPRQGLYNFILHFVNRITESQFAEFREKSEDYIINYTAKYKEEKNLKKIKLLCDESKFGISFAYLLESYAAHGGDHFDHWLENNFGGLEKTKKSLQTKEIFKVFAGISQTWQIAKKPKTVRAGTQTKVSTNKSHSKKKK